MIILSKPELIETYSLISLRFRKMINLCATITDAICDDDLFIHSIFRDEARFAYFRKSQSNGMIKICEVMNEIYIFEPAILESKVAIIENRELILKMSIRTTTVKERMCRIT